MSGLMKKHGRELVTVDRALIQYEEVCAEIASFITIDETLKFANLADLLRLKAKQALNRDTELLAIELRLRAERRCGQIIQSLYDENKIRKYGPSSAKDKRVRLADFGIKSDHAQRFIRWARMDDEDFDRAIAEWKTGCTKLNKVRSFPFQPPEPRGSYTIDFSSPFDCCLINQLGSMTFAQARDARAVLDTIINYAASPGEAKVEDTLNKKALEKILCDHRYKIDSTRFGHPRWEWVGGSYDLNTKISAERLRSTARHLKEAAEL